MKVRCMETGVEEHLTVGKVYDVLETDSSVPTGNYEDYILVGDNGQTDRFMTELFETEDTE